VIARTLIAICIVLLFGPAGAAPGGSVVRVEHRDPSTAPTRGPTTAYVTIELFFVPKSNMAVRMPVYHALEKLAASHPTRIRLIYRVLKRGATQMISIAALEANAQGKFDEFIDVLHKDKTQQSLSKDKILELAKQAGMDAQRLSVAISEGRYNDVFDLNDHRLERLTHNANNAIEPNALFNTKVPRTSLGSPNDTDLEREYQNAYERALELVDRGVPPRRLLQAFEDQSLRSVQPYVVSTGSSDDDFEGDQTDHKLAKPPLNLTGMPSFGNAESTTAIPVIVLCRPNDTGCLNMMRVVRRLQEIYSSDVRVVWAPWFDVTRDDAAELTLLGDAVLCAEQVGSSPDELNASPGWRWINKQLEQVTRARGRRIPAEKLIDTVTADVEIDSRQLSACRARIANTTLDWIAAARKSGVTRSPALVIGGRIYENLNDNNLIQQLIEAELAPGVLARCSTIGCASE
jgi:hypothetical protein